jgi:hypothetical protein
MFCKGLPGQDPQAQGGEGQSKNKDGEDQRDRGTRDDRGRTTCFLGRLRIDSNPTNEMMASEEPYIKLWNEGNSFFH